MEEVLLTVKDMKNRPKSIHNIANIRSANVPGEMSPYPVVVRDVNAQ
jgi:hypothetical protein